MSYHHVRSRNQTQVLCKRAPSTLTHWAISAGPSALSLCPPHCVWSPINKFHSVSQWLDLNFFIAVSPDLGCTWVERSVWMLGSSFTSHCWKHVFMVFLLGFMEVQIQLAAPFPNVIALTLNATLAKTGKSPWTLLSQNRKNMMQSVAPSDYGLCSQGRGRANLSNRAPEKRHWR